MKSVMFYTLGCKLNQSESEALVSKFETEGFFISKRDDTPDLIIVNTCTVTSKAEQKARRMLRKFLRDFENAVIVVTGCYAQLNKQDLEAIDERLIVVSMMDKPKLLVLAKRIKSACFDNGDLSFVVRDFIENGVVEDDKFDYNPDVFSSRSRAFVKVQDGCNNRCSYCRVPLARGNSDSLDFNLALSRCLELEKVGFNELVITGVNICQYSSNGNDLCDLIETLSNNLSRAKIRVSSIEPDYIDDRFARVLGRDNVCPHFHLPLQSGSSSVLKRMFRKYSASQAELACSLLRRYSKNPFLAFDVITGFDGESDEEFDETVAFLERVRPSFLHVFPFSPRVGTASSKPKNPVAERVRDERAELLRKMSDCFFDNYKEESRGRELTAIVENRLDGLGYNVLTENYLKATLRTSSTLKRRDIVKVFFDETIDNFSKIF